MNSFCVNLKAIMSSSFINLSVLSWNVIKFSLEIVILMLWMPLAKNKKLIAMTAYWLPAVALLYSMKIYPSILPRDASSVGLGKPTFSSSQPISFYWLSRALRGRNAAAIAALRRYDAIGGGLLPIAAVASLQTRHPAPPSHSVPCPPSHGGRWT